MSGEPCTSQISDATDRLSGDLVALRRQIHRHPELAGAEERTAALIADRLRNAGLAVHSGIGGHGVVGILTGGRPGRTIAYRADMDAVGDDERFECEYASRVAGAAHLCGHDLHSTIGVGIAEVLAAFSDDIAGRLVFVFQPAEETLDGAAAMLGDGVLRLAEPSEIYAVHCAPLPVGAFAVYPGQPGLDRFTVALPDGADADRVAGDLAAVSTVRRPESDEEFMAFADQMTIENGPLERFVTVLAWADGEGIHGSFRAWPDDRGPEVRARLARIVDGVPGARITFPGPPFPAMVNDSGANALLADHLGRHVGPENVIVLHAAFPFNGEDFGLFLHRVPGAMVFLGVANPEAGINGMPHAPDFAADEAAIAIGVRTMAGLLLQRAAQPGESRMTAASALPAEERL